MKWQPYGTRMNEKNWRSREWLSCQNYSLRLSESIWFGRSPFVDSQIVQPWGEANYYQLDHWRDRQQRVKFNNNWYSSWLNVPAGVLQGTRLGPLRLFLAIINDLKLPGESFSMWKFVDVTTVSEVVRISGEGFLQEAVNHISSWSHNNLFQFNSTKCSCLFSLR